MKTNITSKDSTKRNKTQRKRKKNLKIFNFFGFFFTFLKRNFFYIFSAFSEWVFEVIFASEVLSSSLDEGLTSEALKTPKKKLAVIKARTVKNEKN